MSLQCGQALDNGEPCNAPSVNGSAFCRHHDPQRPPKQVTEKFRENEPLVLPSLLDKPSILTALNVVVQALAEGRIKRSIADTLITGMKLAIRLVTEIGEAGGTIFPANPEAFDRFQPPQADQSLAPSNGSSEAVYKPTLLDLDEFKEIMQYGSPDQLRDHIVAKQTACLRNQASDANPQRANRQPSVGALTRLAASGNTAAANHLAASQSQKHPAL